MLRTVQLLLLGEILSVGKGKLGFLAVTKVKAPKLGTPVLYFCFSLAADTKSFEYKVSVSQKESYWRRNNSEHNGHKFSNPWTLYLRYAPAEERIPLRISGKAFPQTNCRKKTMSLQGIIILQELQPP